MAAETLILLQEKGFELDEVLAEIPKKDAAARKECLRDYLNNLSSSLNDFSLPPVKAEWSWFNVGEPLTHEHLRGRIVVLDFFTYCCVNCLHILPDLAALEARHDRERVLVVGVHSAKFDNEKSSENVRAAVQRYGITHPVVNDYEALWWKSLGIACWPTLLVLDPSGAPVRMFVGEGHGFELLEFVDVLLERFSGIADKPEPLLLPAATDPGSETKMNFLRYPGKVFVDHAKDRVFVSDTGHHRVVAADKEGGAVLVIAGNGQKGFKDGDVAEAQFDSPQGLCLLPDGNSLVVADTENHAIRLVDLIAGDVKTLYGTGKAGKDLEGGGNDHKQELSSPWDVCLGHSPQRCKEETGEFDTVFVAMAGCHQIWAFALEESLWWKGQKRQAGQMFRVAGSGKEENRNNSYPLKAGFAQPSGIYYSKTQAALFVADSESSSIRKLCLADGAVKNVCGGDRDPTNLFAFGDADGSGISARLQHPLGITGDDQSGLLFVADSYNHKVKKISTQEVTTVVGGNVGDEVSHLGSVKLSEPGGLFFLGERENDQAVLYVADTNNHVIRAINVATDECHVVPVNVSTDQPDSVPSKAGGGVLEADMSARVRANKERSLSISILLTATEPFEVNTFAPNSWKILRHPSGTECRSGDQGEFSESAAAELRFEKTEVGGSWAEGEDIILELCAYFCNNRAGVCVTKNFTVKLAVDDGKVDHVDNTVKVCLNEDKLYLA